MKKPSAFPYEDLLYLPHPVSRNHPQMSVRDRAAQFSPFAALTGHEAAVQEAARITQARPELDDSEKEQLNETLFLLLEKYQGHPNLCITYFQPDDKKEGGKYVTETGIVRKIDMEKRLLCMEKQAAIELDMIVKIEENQADFI